MLIIFSFIAIFSCAKQRGEAEKIIDRSIAASGGKLYETTEVSFNFREIGYVGKRVGGIFFLQRTINDSIGQIIDTYTNESFVRTVDGSQVAVADTMVSKYEQSINSVFYFALLPFKLNDAAVNKEFMGEISINGKDYYKIKVFFDQEGGGQDHDDIFIYWINKETFFIDYLAYEYTTDGGGIRFREAFNEQIVGGIRFADYVNYKPKEKGSVVIEEIDKAFMDDRLVELSKIELKDIRVEGK